MRVRVTNPGPRTEYLGYYVCVRTTVAAESVLLVYYSTEKSYELLFTDVKGIDRGRS
jgi:hypothetical protein